MAVNKVYATSYVIINQEDNTILEGTNYHEVRSVASISKMMTAIVTIENCDIYQYTYVPKEVLKVTGSSIYLKPNEKIQVIDLLYGLMLRSGNDAAITLAYAVASDVDVFVEMMNQKAQKLQMNNTFFSNPTGLDIEDAGNQSTAYDMAILHAYCLQNEVYSRIVSTKKYKTFVNKNKLLQQYEFCTGGKTGFTNQARRTLVSSASKENINLVMVTLNCGNDFEIHRMRYEYYFENYFALTALKKGFNYIDDEEIYLEKNYAFLLKKGQYNQLYLQYEINPQKKHITLYLFDENNHLIQKKEVRYCLT